MSDERKDDDTDSEEFDWSEAERRARMFDHIAEVMKRISERKYVPVQLAKLTKGSRFVVTTYSDGHDPLDCTLLDPAAGTVMVHDNFYFTEPTTCVLFGSDDDLDGNGTMLP